MRIISYESYREQYRAPEGEINFIYGRIGSGKTYVATAIILDLLDKGFTVYANWRVEWPGSMRPGRFRAAARLFFGIRRYDIIPKGNFHYIEPEAFTAEFISKLVDCYVFADEGQNLLDSYEGKDFSKTKRRLLQYTRHFHRTLYVIAQRTQSVQVTARAQVNRFYRCSRKPFPLWPRFVLHEFADLAGEDVAETANSLVSERHYWGSKRVFAAYDSKYMREGVPYEYPGHVRAILTFWESVRFIFGKFNLASQIEFAENLKKKVGDEISTPEMEELPF
jgi:hypothetical protein